MAGFDRRTTTGSPGLARTTYGGAGPGKRTLVDALSPAMATTTGKTTASQPAERVQAAPPPASPPPGESRDTADDPDSNDQADDKADHQGGAGNV